AFFGLDLGDIDKDGDYDIAVGSNEASLGIQIYLNDGVGGWAPGIAPTSVGIYNDVILADLNGDTRLDLAAASQGGGINVWVGTSSGFWNFWYHPITTHNFNRICVDDFTLNGSLDMAGASSVFGLALWDNLTPGVFQEYFAITPDNLAFGSIAIGKCAYEQFQLENVSPDTLRNVVVYTTNPAFSVSLDPPNIQPFDLLPAEVRTVEVSYCPVDSVVENEVIIIHSSVAVTHIRATGEGVPYIQPLWSMNVSVENAAGPPDSIGLEFGGGIGATDSLDIGAGEICLPPLPPSAVFDARFLIAGCEGSLTNIHDYYAETDSFVLQWQAGAGGYPVTVSWDPNSLPDGTFLISDLMGGAFIDTLNMADTSQVVIPPAQSFITQLSITTLRKSTFANDVHQGWQIRSLAVAADQDSLQDLFPGAISAFTWNGGYIQVDQLGVGTGYWVYMAQDTVVS
ncbi:MAG: VCBS repeat-containing protein, partial [Candidatus Krumholzibacteria bacterium]|nr:VCBS repeat-containing protein [Candidatus Krumholzibacteria bacterium]